MRRLRSQTRATTVFVLPFVFYGGRGAAPYGLIRKCGSPPCCFVLTVCFIRAIRESPLRVIKISVPYFGEQPSLSVGEGFPLPQRCSHYLTATRRILINICRAGAMFAKQTCHGAKRSMLASRRDVVRTIFWIHTNEWISLDLGRGGPWSSRRFVLILCMRREQAPALRFITICGAPPLCLFVPFVFTGDS